MVSSFRAWLPERTDEAALTRYSDAGAELHLRGAGRPFDAVRAEMDAARAQMRDGDDDSNDGLRDKLRAFVKSMNDQPN